MSCDVMILRDGKALFQAVVEHMNRSARQLSILSFKPHLVAHQKDPFKILSIYAYRFPPVHL